MESVEKLRQAIGSPELTYEGERVGYSWYAQNILEHVNAVEREIAERYMELPVDADGVPIHVGDKMNRVDGGPGHRAGAVCREGFNDAPIWCANDFCHVKPRTIEDVLRDVARDSRSVRYEDGADVLTDEVIAKYADELRQMGVGV